MISEYKQDLASCLLKVTIKDIQQFLSLISLIYVISPVIHQKSLYE